MKTFRMVHRSISNGESVGWKYCEEAIMEAHDEIERLRAALDACEADLKERVDQCNGMANDWADFCSSLGVTWDTQEAVACEINAEIDRLKCEIDALDELLSMKDSEINASLKGGKP